MSEVFQVLLSGKRCSGRGVRFKELTAPDHDQLTLDAAKQLGPEGTMLELRKIESRMGVRSMIVGVTRQSGLKDLNAATWDKVTTADVEARWTEFFTAKDDAVLLDLFRSFHEVSQSEMEDISKTVIAVSED